MTEQYKLTAEELINIFAGHPIDQRRVEELSNALNNCHKEKSEYMEMANKLIGTSDVFLIQSMIRTEQDINARFEAAIKEYAHYKYDSIIKPAVNAYAAYIEDPAIDFSEIDICCLVMDYMDVTPFDNYQNKANADEVLTYAIDDFMSFVQKKYPQYKPNTSKMFENEKTVVPDKAVIITDKSYRTLFNSNETGLFLQENGTNNFPITRIVHLDYSDLDDVLDDNDKLVTDSIVTHFAAGNSYISYQMIYRIMTRNPNARLTPQMNDYEDIRKSVRKLLRTTYNADITEEAKLYPALRNFQMEVEEPLVLGRIITAKGLNGQVVDSVLQVVDAPILYRLAYAKGQFKPVDIKLIATPANKSKLSLFVGDILERWIVWKQHDNEQYEKRNELFPLSKRTLTLEYLYNEVLEQPAPDLSADELRKYKERIKKQKQRLPGIISEKLTAYSMNGFIRGYVMDNERIRIALNETQSNALKKYVAGSNYSYIP